MSQESEKLFENMTDIDDRFIEEAAMKHPHKCIQKRHKTLIPLLVAGGLCLCGFGYQMYSFLGAGYTKDVNQQQLKLPFETGSEEQNSDSAKESQQAQKRESNPLIENKNDVFAESFQEIDLKNGRMTSMYFSPEYMLIFLNNGKGWSTKGKNKIRVDFRLNEDQSLYLECGYIDNGKYKKVSLSKGNVFGFTIPLKDGHIYYPCVSNRSSDNAIIQSGKVIYEAINE